MNCFYKLVLLATASIGLIGMAHAQGRLVEFTQVAKVQDVACVIPEEVPKREVFDRTAQYQITNFGPTSVNLVFELENNDRFLDAMFSFEEIDCATIESESFATGSLAPGASCVIELLITPPDCPVINYLDPSDIDAQFGPLNGPINRVLEIDINTRQVELTKRIRAKVSTLGAAAEFGLLGCEIYNDDTVGPTQVDNGSVGAGQIFDVGCEIEAGASGISGEVQVINGVKYLEYNALSTQIALMDLIAAGTMFDSQINFFDPICITPQSTNTDTNDLSGVTLGPNTYCLEEQYVDDLQTLTLSGPGTYIFFVGIHQGRPVGPCYHSFCLGEYASVVAANGASIDNIFWLLYDSEALSLDVNSTIVGNIMSPDGIDPFEDVAQVNGRMLTIGSIFIYGNSITVE